jgi:hypothetical protein
MTKDRPNLSVRMLGSAALELPFNRRLGLKVAAGGAAALADPDTAISKALTVAVTAMSPVQ